MRNKVGLYIRETSDPRRYLKPHTKNFYAIVDGQPVYLSDGVYRLRYGYRWERLPGCDLKTARLLQQKREAEILAGVLTLSHFEKEIVPQKEDLSLRDAIERYLASVAGTKSEKTAKGYDYTLGLFLLTTSKRKTEGNSLSRKSTGSLCRNEVSLGQQTDNRRGSRPVAKYTSST